VACIREYGSKASDSTDESIPRLADELSFPKKTDSIRGQIIGQIDFMVEIDMLNFNILPALKDISMREMCFVPVCMKCVLFAASSIHVTTISADKIRGISGTILLGIFCLLSYINLTS